MPSSRLLLPILALAFACSQPVQRPSFKQSAADAKPSTGDDGSGQMHGGQKPGQVDTGALKATTEQILAATHPTCKTESKVEASTPLLRLLSREEYANTIRDVLGLAGNHANDFPIEPRLLGFRSIAKANLVSDVHMDGYMNAAKTIASEFVRSGFDGKAGCAVSQGESCAQGVITRLAPRIWRRAITSEESTRLLTLYRTGTADGGNEAGMILLLRGLLSSPHFLYRTEIGKSGQLTADELGHALSYFFWTTVPDDELRSQMASGALLQSDVLLKQAQRLMQDPRSGSGLRTFADSFLLYTNFATITKDMQKFPAYTNEVRDAMKAEAEATIDYWIRTKRFGFDDFMFAETSAGSPVLANFYGATAGQDGAQQTINFANQKRRGVLGLGAVLAGLATPSETNPVKRGAFVREHLLCEILLLPTGIEIPPVPVQPGLSTRERFEAHTANPSCQGCHVRIDGIGFGMEDYDAVGMIREMDQGKSVDASGTLAGLDGKDMPFDGTDSLSKLLKDSQRAKRCFVLQAFRQSAGRFESAGDVCTLRSIGDEFIAKDSPLADVLIQIITNPQLNARKGS